VRRWLINDTASPAVASSVIFLTAEGLDGRRRERKAGGGACALAIVSARRRWRNVPMITRRQLALAGTGTLSTPFVLRAATAQEGRTAYDLISRTPAVSIFAEVIRNHGLEEHFSTGRHGYFIPVGEAIERLPALQVERYRSDRELARQTVLNHVTDFLQPISGWAGAEYNESFRVTTLAGRRYTLVVSNMKLPRIAGHPITYMNYRASNGLCHAIDGILAL
jgi:uncharacterized surface protein with fasciclin (FAS1) repeats